MCPTYMKQKFTAPISSFEVFAAARVYINKTEKREHCNDQQNEPQLFHLGRKLVFTTCYSIFSTGLGVSRLRRSNSIVCQC